MTQTRTNEEWLHDLSESGAAQENAIADLQDILLRAVLYLFNRNLGDLTAMARDDILQLAEDCAQEALIAIMNHLSDFRGDSKFTTWAYKFAINIGLMAARRVRWKDVSLDQLSSAEDGMVSEWIMQDKSSGVAPDQAAMQSEVRQVIREVMERDLTDKQRRVLLLMVFHEVPMDEVVRQLDTNRNAVYKMLHDARRKLKSGLQSRGFEVGETLTLFGSQG
ncbi:MAG TPA: sigma-70 family RNA polymerase sigma factor [Anaerolineales bacterium]|nr:sigma-70 family RNA polymerase sigma factor [Anaerolineales bacterium]